MFCPETEYLITITKKILIDPSIKNIKNILPPDKLKYEYCLNAQL